MQGGAAATDAPHQYDAHSAGFVPPCSANIHHVPQVLGGAPLHGWPPGSFFVGGEPALASGMQAATGGATMPCQLGMVNYLWVGGDGSANP